MHIKNKIITALTLAVLFVPGISMAQTMSVSQLQAEIASLTAQLTQLEAQLAGQGGSVSWCYTFNTNLSIGMTGAGVSALQTALQKDGESVTVSGTFDDQTAAAVTGFQEKYASAILAPYGLSNGTGYAGKSTRAELNSLFGCGTIPVQPIGPAPVQPTPVNPSPAMSVYRNSQYGVQFSYPSNYTVKYGNDAFGNSNNPLGDDGIGMENSNLTSLITIEMPSNSYPDTGFDGAYFNVSVGTQMTSSQCSAMNAAGSSPISGTKTIGGVPFNWSVEGSAAAGTDFTNGSFSGYANGICYVLLTGGVEGNGAIGNVGSDGVAITAVNQNSILAALNSVLATMTFSAPANGGYPASSITVTAPTGGTFYQGAMMGITWVPMSGLNNVGLGVVGSSGVVVSGPNGIGTMGMITAQTTDNGSYQWQIPSNFPAGTYRVSVTGYANGVAYQGYGGYFTIIPPPTICPAWGCGNPPIVTSTISTTLNVQANSAFPSGSTIAGAESQRVASYIITAPSSESITLSQLGLTIQGSASSLVGLVASFNPQLAASTYGHGGTYGLVSSGRQSYQANLPAQFNATIPAGGSMTVDIYAVNIDSSAAAGSQIISSLNCTGKGNISYAIYQCATTQGQTITIARVSNPTMSTLDMSKDSSSPAGNIPSGSTQETFGVFDLAATGGESVKVLSLPVVFSINGSNVTGGELTNVRIMEGSTQIGQTISSLTSGNTNGASGNGVYDATFGSAGNPLNLIVPGNATAKITIVADVSASASGDSISAGIGGGFLGNAVGSIYNLNIPLGDVGSNTIYPIAGFQG